VTQNIILLEKTEVKFTIIKNSDFEFLTKNTYLLYEKFVINPNYSELQIVWNNEMFSTLMKKLLNQDAEVKLNLEELMWLKEWIDIICKTLLDLKDGDFKKESILKYFYIAEKFVAQTNEYIPELIN